MTELVQARVDSKIKRQASKIFNSLGMDMSTGIKVYLATVVREQGVPFNLTAARSLTPEQENEILADSAQTMADYRAGKIPKIRNSKELHKFIMS